MNQSTGNNTIVENINCFFNDFYTYDVSLISYPSVISAETTRLTNRPKAGINKTNSINYILMTPSKLLIESPPITRAAQTDSAKEPNKSAPIPAISPTLSPTLSAMVAGLRGLSSGNPD